MADDFMARYAINPPITINGQVVSNWDELNAVLAELIPSPLERRALWALLSPAYAPLTLRP